MTTQLKPGLLSQKQFVCLVFGLVPGRNFQTLEKGVERLAVTFFDLESHQDTTEIGAVIAVVEQAYVPAITDLHQKI